MEYRIWGDDYIEQGGRTNLVTGTVTLYKTMKNTDYGITLTVSNYSGNKDMCVANYDDSTISKSSFGVRVKNYGNGAYANTFWWIVRGY